jgi:hypothetical protein
MMLLVMVFFTSGHLGMAVVIATLLMIHMIVNDVEAESNESAFQKRLIALLGGNFSEDNFSSRSPMLSRSSKLQSKLPSPLWGQPYRRILQTWHGVMSRPQGGWLSLHPS